MADRAEQLQQIADHVAELAQPIHSAEPYERYDRRAKRRKQFTHTVVLPSLLDQVRHAAYPSPSKEDIFVAAPYTSRAAARLDAVAVYQRILFASQGWLHAAGLAHRPTVEDNLHGLVGVAAGLDPARLRLLTHDVADWHHRAQVLTEWVAAPKHPHVDCPVCEKRGGLWLRVDTKTGGCGKCGAHWDEATIGVIADHVRAAADTTAAPGA